MATRIVSATEFKAKCLSLLDEMEQGGEPITITDDLISKKRAELIRAF